MVNLRNGNIHNKKVKKNTAYYVIWTIRLISIIVILVCIGILIYRHLNLKDAEKVIESVNTDIVILDKNVNIDGNEATVVEADISKLDVKNEDSVGYIKVNGTNIAYPVVQSSDNDYYLRHSFDKSYSQAGWIFLDYRNNPLDFDKNTIIYGHNMLNQTMFSTLTKMTNQNFFNNSNNHYINFSTENKSTVWKIFSVYVTNPETYYLNTGFSNNEEYNNFLNTIKERSNISFNENVNENDKILTLSTCTNLNTKRLVVHAKLVYEEVK